MKNSLQRLLLLLTLGLFVFNSNAQVPIGSGTEVGEALPVEPYFGYTYSQSIYLASEIQASGTITGITFEATPTTTLANTSDWVVYLAASPKTSYASTTDWEPIASFTEVFNGTVSIVGGEVVITFTTPFVYNGTDNLIVAVEDNTPGFDGSSDDFYCTTVTGDRSITYRDDVTDPDPTTPPTATGLRTSIPNIVFSGITQACPVPTALTATNITATSADIGWTENGSANTWNIEYGAAGFTPTGTPTITGTSNNPEPLTGLTSATDYEFYVQADCGGSGTSNWAGPFSFTTACGTFTPVYNEDFTSYIPNCWEEATGLLTSSSTLTLGSSSWTSDGFANNGSTGAARMNIYTTGQEEWLISPSIDLTGGPFQLEYDVALTEYAATTASTMDADDSLAVVISTDNGATWSNTNILRTYTAGSEPSNTGQREFIDLSAYTGIVKLGFYAVSTQDLAVDNDISIDNFVVQPIPLCPQVSAINATNVTGTSLDLGWTENGSANTWNIEYGAAGFTPTGTPTIAGTTNNPEPISGLTAETSYDFYVQADCAGNGTSTWTGPYTVTTPCAAFDGDDATTPIILSGTNASATGNTSSCFTDQWSGPGFPHSAPDAWYRYILDPCSDSLVVSLCGSSFDTYLAIVDFDGTSLIDDNDDNFTECGGGGNSYLEIDLATTAGISAGDTVYIIVDGYGSDSGNYSLNVSNTSPESSVTTTTNGAAITADASGVSYQWLDCDNANAVIAGENTQTFVAAMSGNYAVEVTDNGCVDTSACEAITVSPADLIITEINYNGAESGTDSTEFIEVYNNGTATVNMSGYTFSQGVSYTAGANTLVPSGGYIVFAVDSMAMVNVYGYSGAYEFTGGLSNGGEDITIVDASGVTIDSVDYDDGGVWPSGFSAGEPDGGGSSLILCDYSSDNNDGSNWSVSTAATGTNINGFDVFGSPGAANSCLNECPSAFAITACDSYIVPSGDETYTTSGVYMDTIVGTAGCDSVMTITLTINNSSTGTDVQTACDSYTWIDGNTYTASNNTATFVLTNAAGCDSTVTLDLTINTVDVSVTTNAPSITANATGASYEWLDCDDGYAPIAGETGQTFTAASNGNYAVEVTENGCVDTSACTIISTISLDELDDLSGIAVYPNPVKNTVYVEMGSLETATISLLDINGKVLFVDERVENSLYTFEMNQAPGIYFVEVRANNSVKQFKLVKQ